MIRVAVIDNGICENYIKRNILHYKIIENTVVKEMNDTTNKLTHGTICAYIIAHIMKQSEIIDIKAFDSRYGTIDNVVLALEWCLTNDISIINMSFGTVNLWEYSKLEKIIRKLAIENIYLVSAFNNFHIKSYPAAYEKVFGVRADKGNILKNGEFDFIANQGLNKENTLVAHWDLQECQEELYQDKFPYRSSSFSAPVITGYIARCLVDRPKAKFEEVLKYLEKEAVRKSCKADKIDKIYTNLNLPSDVPVIAFKSDDIEIAIELKQFFEQEGYAIAFVTEGEKEKRGIPLDIYCNAEELTEEVVASIAYIYKADLLILCLHDNQANLLKKTTIDIVIIPDADIYRLEYNSKSIICNTIMELYEVIYSIYK